MLNLGKMYFIGFCVSEKDVVHQIEQTETGEKDRPVKDVAIKDCGILPVDEPFHVDKA